MACSTKKDTFLARNSHALSTKYNILYNGQIAFDKGMQTVNSAETDNFWEILPVERMLVQDPFSEEARVKNPDFELAETKATKAIQKHSMNIGGKEKNFQMDEAYLLLGKSRYYEERFIPALDAFNYILYKYPTSSNINTARIWREKTNMRLGNEAIVIKNINQILKDVKVDPQAYADAHALLAEAFFNIQQNDSTIVNLQIAEKFTKKNPERARYRFILGQLFQAKSERDSALAYYQSVIDMNRKGDRKYLIHSYAKKAQLFDYENGDKQAFVERYNKLVDDRENRPFLDVLYYEMGVFFDKTSDQQSALEFYNASLQTKSADNYLVASNYRNIGNMYFKNTDYTLAAKYYDSTLVKLNPKSREYVYLEKKRLNLDDVIKYEAIAQQNDSILKVIAYSPEERTNYYQKYIDQLQAANAEKQKKADEDAEKQENLARSNPDDIAAAPTPPGFSTFGPPTSADAKNVFYFYNPTTVAYGKLQFKKNFGNRTAEGQWRTSLASINQALADGEADSKERQQASDSIVIEPKYTVAYYTDQLPTDSEKISSLKKDRDFAYYQLGLLYKENFKEYDLASEKLEQLLVFQPEEKLVLPTEYNLYKIYQITNPSRASSIKNQITTQYPDSRYAQIINNTASAETNMNSADAVYKKYYELYEAEQFSVVLDTIDDLIREYSGEEIASKFELLKANALGKTKGLAAYKSGLEEVATHYPNSEEGKNAQDILAKQIPVLEKMEFTTVDEKNWKILYQIPAKDEKAVKEIETKFKKFLNDENYMKLTFSVDQYNGETAFCVIHAIKSQSYAYDLAKLLKEDKKYKIQQEPIVISSSNYSIVQIKKNIDAYTALKTP
ncbi:gliding motility protein [Flavobacterium sp. SE-1-e]|uniref:Gliding motility protein n=2 Tax=Flavobacterium agrisoli TaxID=2793066 RepID=A0A934UJN3_9FLAO|nr:gliding motility protein [Flavobacterium agrisoli]MBK0369600.1 gliding motility protein [Flavobacterium agrisoli]